MKSTFTIRITPGKGIFIAILLSLFGAVLFYLIGLLSNAFYTGSWDLASLIAPSSNTAEGLMSIRIMQSFQTIGMFVFPAIVIGFLTSKSLSSFLGFRGFSKEILFLSILMMIIFIPGINLIASLNSEIPVPQWMIDMEKNIESLVKTLLQTEKPSILFLNLIVVAVLPAVGEELFFRGVLQKYLCKITKSTLAGIVITSLFFSAIHIQFLGFIPRFALGMVFGYLYVWSGSIWIPIVVHFVNNSLAVIVYFFIGKGIVPEETETIGNISDLWQLGLLSLILSSIIIWLIWKRRVKSQNQQSLSLASEDL